MKRNKACEVTDMEETENKVTLFPRPRRFGKTDGEYDVKFFSIRKDRKAIFFH